MKAWGIWLITTLFVLVLAVVFSGSWLWNHLAGEWNLEAKAAQFALNHSPLNSISTHDVFTGNGTEEVFKGKDSFGRSWVVAVYGSPMQTRSVQTSSLKSRQQILKEASGRGLTVIATHVGYLDTNGQNQLGTNANFVFEVYGQTKSGTYEYAYFNAVSGKLIRSY